MNMMTSVTWAGIGFREIPDPGNGTCHLIPESFNDPRHPKGTNYSPVRCESKIVFITGEMNGY
jgi:hypothetical protein